MQKFFIITNEKYLDALKTYKINIQKQRDFMKKVFNEFNIIGTTYHLGGNGFLNCAFKDYEKKDIGLSIEVNSENMNNFKGECLSKPRLYDGNCQMYSFRKNSKTMKKIQQRCIDEKVIINVHEPSLRDYVKELGYLKYSYQMFEFDNKAYIMIESDNIKKDDKFDGFDEIKGSEYYLALESLKK